MPQIPNRPSFLRNRSSVFRRQAPALVAGLLGLALGQLVLTACTSAATKQSVRLYEGGDYQGAAAAAERGIAEDRGDDGAWQMRVRAALALGDTAGVAAAYGGYQKARGGDDAELALELAQVTIRQALTSPSVALRIAAIQAVEKSELGALADAVAQRMTDPDDRVVAAAAAAVLRGYADAADALDDMLRSEEPQARRLAIDGLGRKLARHAVGELTAAAEDADAAVRLAALGHLAGLRDDELAPVFQRHLADPDEAVRAECVHALAALARARKAQATAAAALPTAQRDRAMGVRLGAVALAQAVEDRGALTAMLGDADASVAIAAAAALGSEAAVLGPLFDRALASGEWPTKVAALNQATARLGAAAAATRARVALADPELAVRLAAARVLGHAGAKAEAIAFLAEVVARPAATAPSAATATADRSAPAASPARIIEAAVDLIHLGDARGEAALSEALLRGDAAEVRGRAAAAHRLARKITPALLAALTDASGAVRLEAATALAALATGDAG
jgi:HEAT repeat protein